ncbi:hypothetical protein [Chryseobacterium sp.]|uniref:immunoglobulin domain-containing protein n=1 Tax=Chryseobacterium sp. TaxID=1871047 RepID=UPI00389076A6
MNKFYYQIVFVITILLSFCSTLSAQCNINNFNLTPVNGVCAQDGAVQVAIPGGTTCGTATATIRKQGETVDLAFVSLSASGAAQFNNLAPGNYQVQVQQNATTTSYKNVTVTSTYTPLTVTAVPRNTTCGTTDPLYANNGEIKVTFTGGTGPFIISLAGPGGPYTFNTPTATSHTFTNLAPGNYTATVTDNSTTCTSAEARSATITDTNWLPLTYSTIRRQLTDACQLYLRIEMTDGNKQATILPGNATYTIGNNPTVYNLTQVGGIPATGRYAFRTAYGLPANEDINITITDGCRTVTKVINTRAVSEVWGVQQLKTTSNQNCETVFSFTYRTWEQDSTTGAYYWQFSNGARAAFYAEVPAMSDNWVLIEDNFSNGNYYGVAGWLEYQTTYTNTRIKVVFTDLNGCNTYEKIVDGRNAANDNSLNKVVLGEISGVLEGTSTISVNKNNAYNWSGTDSFSYPITFNIARKDGQTNMTVNASQPYNLAGAYNITFPYTKTVTTAPTDYWSSDRPIFGDLPLGEYVVTITDGCGYSVTREINLTKPAGYNPTITYNVGCAASDVVYNMGVNTDTQNIGRVYIYQNNNGVRGSLVAGYNANQILSGTFPSIAPGNYFLVFDNINYYPRLTTALPYDSSDSNVSVARNTSGSNQEYFISFKVDPYEQVTFTTVSLFCDPTDANSGILAVTATGIPVGSITYGVWPSTADPATATPLQTYTTTNLSEMSHVFTNLSAGNYKVRVSTACGFTEQSITIVQGTTVFPQPVSVPGTVCQGSDATLAIAIPNSLFDIEWFTAGGTSIGTGNSVVVVANQNATYTVKYKLKSSYGCANPYTGQDTVDVVVVLPIQEVSRNVVCNTSDNTYTVTVEMSGASSYTVSGTGANGTWNGNTWTSNPIAVGTPYNVTFADPAGCSTVIVNGNSPLCACYKPGVTTGTTLDTKHGITALGRAGQADDNWPMVRKGAWTVLEAKTKGFAINRIATTTQVNAIANPIEGMMVYDEQADCLKVYTSTDNGSTFGWNCLTTQTCP